MTTRLKIRPGAHADTDSELAFATLRTRAEMAAGLYLKDRNVLMCNTIVDV